MLRSDYNEAINQEPEKYDKKNILNTLNGSTIDAHTHRNIYIYIGTKHSDSMYKERTVTYLVKLSKE